MSKYSNTQAALEQVHERIDDIHRRLCDIEARISHKYEPPAYVVADKIDAKTLRKLDKALKKNKPITLSFPDGE